MYVLSHNHLLQEFTTRHSLSLLKTIGSYHRLYILRTRDWKRSHVIQLLLYVSSKSIHVGAHPQKYCPFLEVFVWLQTVQYPD